MVESQYIKSWYFFFFAGLASLFPFLPLFWSQVLGFSSSQIGVLSALRPWLGTISGPVMCFYIDKFKQQRNAFLTLSCLVHLLRIFLFLPRSFSAQLFLVTAATIAGAPVGSFMDSCTLSKCVEPGSYGKIRLFGSLGWGVFSLVSSALSLKENMMGIFVMYGILAACSVYPSFQVNFDSVLKHEVVAFSEEEIKAAAVAAAQVLAAATEATRTAHQLAKMTKKKRNV